MDKLTVRANAKINLTLEVTGRLPNGYHTLRSVMQSISLCDTVTVRRTLFGRTEVVCSDKSIPDNEDNIAFKAAKAFFDHSGMHGENVHISIEKHIPSEAGLGGGSADAAAVIHCLNEIFGCGYPREELCKIGERIGADVPFCIVGGTALCEGIGEKITLLPNICRQNVLIAKGKLGISTKEAYEHIDGAELTHKKWDISDFRDNFKKMGSVCTNDFEVVSDNTEINAIKETMLRFNAEFAQMSGSGSAVFGLFKETQSAESCQKKLVSSGFFAEICCFSEKGIEYL